MSSEHISNLSLNPFFCGKLLHFFVLGHNGNVDFQRLYLALPFILFEPSRRALSNANKKSNFYSMFIENEKQVNLGGIERRYNMYKSLSNESIIAAANDGLIEILSNGKVGSVKNTSYKNEKDKTLRIFYRSAYYLGVIFSNYRTIDLYLKSGVKEI